MTYVVYADVMFLWIFTINHLSYYITCKLLNKKIKIWNLLLWTIITSALLELIYIYSLNINTILYSTLYVSSYFFLFNLYIRIGLSIKNNKLTNVLTANFIGILLISGIMAIFNNNIVKSINYIPVITLICFISTKILYKLQKDISKEKSLYSITININNHIIKTIGYMDTGNTLHDLYNKKPVIIIDYTILKNIITPESYTRIQEYYNSGYYNFSEPTYIGNEIIYPIPYKTISSNFAIMPAFKISKLKFTDTNDTYKNIVAAISQTSFTSNYKVLLNKSLI